MAGRQARYVWVGGLALGIAAAVGLSVGIAQPAKSPAPEALLPAEAVLYVSWDGNTAHKAAWEKTAAYESLYKSGVMDSVAKLVEFALQKGGGDGAGLARQVYDQVSGKGLSLAVTVTGDAGPPLPSATLVLHDAAKLEPGLAQFVKRAAGKDEGEFSTKTIAGRKVTGAVIPDSPGVEVGWWTEGTHLVVVAGVKAVDNAIAVANGKSPNLTASATWKKYRGGKSDFEISFLGWLDIGGLRDTFGNMPFPDSPNPEKPLTINSIAQALGLDTVGMAVTRSGFKGRALWSETTLETTGPRKGLLALAEQKPITLAALPPLPTDTNGFLAASFDWSKFYDDLVALAKSAATLGPPEAAVGVEAIIPQIPQFLGFDPKTDLFDPLGNVLCFYGDPQHGIFGLGFGIAIKVDDAKTLRATINTLLDRVPPSEDFSIVRAKKLGRELISVQPKEVPISPTMTIDDGWLVAGLSPQSVEAFLLRADKKLDAWQPSAAHQEAFALLPKQFTSITVSDPRKTLPALLGWAPMLLTLGQKALQDQGLLEKGATLPITAADIPPAEQVAQPLFPNVSVGTASDAGFHWTSRTSLPSIPIPGLSGGGGIGTTAVAVALLLPAVQKAREAARRTQSQNNLKQIGLCLHNYHDVFNKLPTGTHVNEKLKPEKRLSWQVTILPYLEQAPMYERINLTKSWDDPANEMPLKIAVQQFLNPALPGPNGTGLAVTHYVGLAGLGKDAPLLEVTSEKAGVFGYERRVRFQDILDGTSNTIAVSEASKDFGPWGAGGPSTIRGLTTKPYINGPDGIGGPYAGGCNVLFMDGSVRFLSKDIDPTVLEALVTIRGGEIIQPDQFGR